MVLEVGGVRCDAPDFPCHREQVKGRFPAGRGEQKFCLAGVSISTYPSTAEKPTNPFVLGSV